MNPNYPELFVRNSENPILTASMWPYPVHTVFNPGATILKDGNTLLLCRMEDRKGLSQLGIARSKNGLNHWIINPSPFMTAEPEIYPAECWGIEDPRITFISELNQYIICYVSYGKSGPSVSLAITENFEEQIKLGMVLKPNDKDAALFPRKIQDRWVMLHRPIDHNSANIWISYSVDLMHWKDRKLILGTRTGGWWDAEKIGLGAPPIETKEGWLIIYHGVKKNASGYLYRIGLALLDLEHPDICIKRTNDWIFAPETDYERFGDVKDVVFPCGLTLLADNDTIHLYYGAADTSIGVATGSVRNLLDWLQNQ
ncbi:MAG: glycosidase [Leptospira bouyouniensis]